MALPAMPQVESEEPALEQLIRAIVLRRDSEVEEAYETCFEIGKPIVPAICEKIKTGNWRNLGASGEKLRYLTTLMYLLHDIDEAASRELSDDLVKRRCHPVVAAKLRSLHNFTLDDFEAQTDTPLTLYVAKAIPSRETVWRYLNTWLGHIPAEDLAGVHRLYVIKEDRSLRYWGLYFRPLSVVSLVWRPSSAWNRLAFLQTEMTLYHEIGHHADRRESEPTETREAFADTYAERLFRKVHPRLGKRWIEFFIMPSHSLRKLRRLVRTGRR